MAYLDKEVSKHSGRPTELYKFIGTYADFFYTSGPKKVRFPDTIDGDWYLPIAMRRSEVNCGTQDDDGLDITIELSVKNEIVQVYAFQDSPPALDLTIYRFHDIAFPVQYWTGPINDIQVSDGVATIRSPSTLGAALDANVPNVYYQSPCNHVLYDARCKVVEADWTKNAIVTGVAGRVIEVNSAGTLDGKLIGGELRVASGERRMITAQNAGVVIVNFPFSQIAEDDAVTLTAGCDLAYNSDCKLKFNNNCNFGGFPFIPAANPFQDGVDPSVVPLIDNTCLPAKFEGWFSKITLRITDNNGITISSGNPTKNLFYNGGGFVNFHVGNTISNGSQVIAEVFGSVHNYTILFYTELPVLDYHLQLQGGGYGLGYFPTAIVTFQRFGGVEEELFAWEVGGLFPTNMLFTR